MSRRLSSFALLFIIPALTCGCADTEPITVADAAPVAKPQAASTANQQDEAAKARAELIQAMTDYVAPYPDRGELFVPPKSSPTTVTTRSGQGNVVLRGLVNVGEPQAVLDIEGATALVGEGSEKYGVKVLKIENRKVTLSRGVTEWTASLD